MKYQEQDTQGAARTPREERVSGEQQKKGQEMTQ